MPDDLTSSGSIGPLNFFRMFRFGPTSSTNPPAAEPARVVPVIIVGIRSVNPRETDGRDGRASTFLEALSSTPIPTDADSRRSSFTGRTRSTRSYNTPGIEGEAPAESFIPATSIPSPAFGSTGNLRSLQSDEGDFSSAPNGGPRWNTSHASPDELQRSLSSHNSDDDLQPAGLVSPDSPRPPAEGTRSWIIYVLGGSYPENHPILTTPSLFTDAPTYEDMMLLSSLIAPVKPPVASREDVESAGGLFRVRLEGSLEVQSEDDREDFELRVGERCLVCLSDFENGEVCRQLARCQHIFHQDCIDEGAIPVPSAAAKVLTKRQLLTASVRGREPIT
ncbi:hypothetical protein DRE_03315 [Drechslerella stenobrocha 248]|uniref:RING-type domain-containing protein n=1 Tax=Drechslerella stenobrocha 248 TaxID=1043628 RepID=W7HSX7_9PEZI|nr:hypothetical protein DRE_03315 [Drechslerella stenobrocha 248]